jgi:streptogramin lyase
VRLLLGLLVLLVLAAPASAKGPVPPPEQTLVVSTGPEPCGIAARGGRLWVSVHASDRLLVLDARSGRRERSIRVGRGACRIAVGGAATWVTREVAGELLRVSHSTGSIARTKVGAWAFEVTLAYGSAWVTSFRTGVVSRLDARSLRRVWTYADGIEPAGITACAGSVWVGHGGDATWLTAIDPRTHRVRRVDVVAEAPAWPRCIRGELWVTTTDAVLRVDARTGELLSHFPVGGTPTEAALGPDGLVWVTDKERSLVHRIDPRVGVVDAFPAGPGAFELVRTGSAMWVTSYAGADVRKFGS